MKIKIFIGFIGFIAISAVFYKFFYKKTNQNSPKIKQTVGETRIIIPAEVKKDTNIVSIQVRKEEFIEKILLKGEVQADPDRIVQITSRLAGRITKVSFKQGSYVKKDSVLLELESMEASKLRSKYINSLTKFQAIEKNKNRIKELASLRLAGEQELINAETEWKGAEAELKSDKANLVSMSIPLPDLESINSQSASLVQIRSPINGICISRDAIVGGQVEPNKSLATVGDLSKVWFIVKVFENDLSKVQEGAKAKITLNSYPEEEFSGIVSFIASQVDAMNRTISARIEMDNRSMLARIGLFGQAELEINTYNVLVVHPDSIFEMEKNHYVFVETRPGEFDQRKIELGRKNNNQVEIRKGLVEGEFVVKDGVYNLKARLLKSTFGED
jgi:cobalt-zinc-cadmium efflux system membrane fusion protein